MNEFWLGLAIPLTLGVLGWIGGRFSVKTKQQVKLEGVCTDVTEMKHGMQIILQCQLASMVALKNGKVNGECDSALKALNNYLIEK